MRKHKKVNKSQKLIIFDFDGVIATGFEDRLDEMLKEINKVANKHGLEKFDSINDLKEIGSSGIKKKLKELKIPKRKYIKVYWDLAKIVYKFWKEAKPYKDVKKIIKKLKKQGNILVIASRNHSLILNTFLIRYKMRRLFNDVMGENHGKDKSKNLEYLVKKHAFRKKDTIFITDTVEDIKDAKKVEIKVIAVTYGIDSKKELKKAKPNLIVNSLKEVISFV